MSWVDAQEFCRRLSEKDGATYRLPTEGEWEYACRAGTTTLYHFGNGVSRLGDYAWYGRSIASPQGQYAQQVGLKKANAFGLHEVHGSVWEWCQDWHGWGYYASSPSNDPPGASSGSYRVLRGGGWYNNPRSYRSALRLRKTPGNRRNDLGFRVAAVPSRGQARTSQEAGLEGRKRRSPAPTCRSDWRS